MRSRIKMLATVAMAAGLMAATVITANAKSIGDGQWRNGTGADASKYWFATSPDGSSYLANRWMWIKGSDGVVRGFYFDAEGWMAANTTVDGKKVDADGCMLDANGNVEIGNETEVDFYTHQNDFAAAAQTQTQTPAQTQTQTPASTVKGNTIKGSGAGDNPANMQAPALGYAVSAVNGKTITNSWANFTMTFPSNSGTILVGAADEGFDVQNITNDAELTIRYVPVGEYGGTTLDSFIAGFVKDGRDGLMGATLGADITFGDYTFKQVALKVPNPSGTVYDHAYFRVVDGTGYVQVINVEQNGSSEDFASTLNTMRKIA